MKRDQTGYSGSRSSVNRVSTARASSSYVVGELNIGGTPCQVVYRGPESEPQVGPAPFRVEPSGAVRWDEPAAVRPASSGALARREEARLVTIEAPAVAHDTGPAEPPQGGDLQKLHRLLRGRYLLAAVLALVLGSVGVWAGLRFGYKTYQSTGLITITPIHLFQAHDNSQSIEQFMLAQAAKFKSQRVLDGALDDPQWAVLGVARTDAFEASFAKELDITQQGQMLLVKFTDRNPEAATLAVDTSMRAFKKLFDAEQKASGAFTTDQWNTARNDLNLKLTSIQSQIDDQAGMYGPEGLEARREMKVQELRDVEQGLTALEMMQVQMSASPTPLAAGPTTQPANLSAEEISRLDPLLQSLITRRLQLQQQMAELSAGGAMQKLPKLEQIKTILASVQDDIEKRADEWRATHLHTDAPVPVLIDKSNTQYLSPQEIKAKAAYLQGRHKSLEEELKGLSQQIGTISKLRIQKDRILKDLNTAEEELQQDEIEKTKWRVDISDADRPLGAFRDTRITFAGAGGLGGVLLGFGFVLLLGLTDRRVRDPHDAMGQLSSGPVLGLLPQLPEDLADPEQAAAVAHSVHEVRALLQIWGRGQNHQVFGITSAVAGSGKTSLSLALGVSFAASKFNTLLIDCDLVGGGLTSRADTIVRRRIGQLLMRDGYISEAQLSQALKLARGSGRLVGEVLVELGYLAEEDLATAIAAQLDQQVGLLDALAGEPLESCVAPSGIGGLSILPIGSATARDAGSLSPDTLHRVLAAAREQFDIVLVDTGPVPGSLEASMIASQVDALVMTVARGDRAPDIQRAMAHLRAVGARVAGIVFNRARHQDIARYGSSRMSSAAQNVNEAGADIGDAPESARLGPVARAVASFSGSGAGAPVRRG